MITGFYAGLLGIMLAILIIRIAMRRLRYRVGIGDGGIPDLAQAMRVHGNFAETVPILLVILFVMEYSGYNPAWLHLFGGSIILCRVLHACGITASPLQSFGRKYGMMLTLLLFFLGGASLILSYVKTLL